MMLVPFQLEIFILELINILDGFIYFKIRKWERYSFDLFFQTIKVIFVYVGIS